MEFIYAYKKRACDLSEKQKIFATSKGVLITLSSITFTTIKAKFMFLSITLSEKWLDFENLFITSCMKNIYHIPFKTLHEFSSF